MNQMLKSHTRQIGGRTLGFEYTKLEPGFMLSLVLPKDADAGYIHKIWEGVQAWMAQPSGREPKAQMIRVESNAQSIAITTDSDSAALEDHLWNLPSELQNAFVETETTIEEQLQENTRLMNASNDSKISAQPEMINETSETKPVITESVEPEPATTDKTEPVVNEPTPAEPQPSSAFPEGKSNNIELNPKNWRNMFRLGRSKTESAEKL